MGQVSMSGKQSVLMDQRGRISFPSGYRSAIGEWLYISPDQSSRHYLVVRSQEGFDAEIAHIKEICREQNADLDPEELEEEIHDSCVEFTGQTQKTQPDKNGRITIDSDLVKYAGLEKNVIVVGVGDYAELWNEEKFHAFMEARAAEKERRRAKREAAKRARLAAETAETEA